MTEIDDIRQAAKAGQLVVVTGAGTSLALASKATPSHSWPKLIESAFEFAEKSGRIDQNQHERWSKTINSGDMDELLGAAEFVSRKIDGRSGLLYSRWLEVSFSKQKASSSHPMRAALCSLHRSGVPIATLNYDTLIERCTKLNHVTMSDHRKVLSWARKEISGVLHLHGIWDDPETVVLGVSDYKDATSDDFRSSLQRSLSIYNKILFIGCGETLYDPNLSSLLQWMRTTLGGASLQHYALVRSTEVDAKLRDPVWQGLVTPISYGRDYDDLPNFVLKQIVPAAPAKRVVQKRRATADLEVIQQYRKYLVSDCGKMTIEGVRADADTAKQKFDLERLFVPLAVDPIPPEFAGTDAVRERKLKEWRRKNSAVLPFGAALEKSGKLALLALPGGGKTLLLKRLAVAYAEPSRRSVTDDHLPDLDLLPILIRCREWRDHINLPISSIISKISEISGNIYLKGLYDAIQHRLQSGQILLLVDGLDEIHSDADRTTFVENLEKFLEEYSKIRLVVTSREAGFALVAPSMMRFCSRWRVAPLSEHAIRLLCSHWHILMDGQGVDSEGETRTVVEAILANDSLRRLAENPLLLTMLLVVKHGYGRLPPDRVSLYDRAVEVLLDTWNIRGHAALNPREAVPQLAYIAFRMMQQGKQTATEKELLAYIEECRREVPMVRHYAKDTPSEFLRRVELRSSLVLEAGKSMESGKAVPFYQFRHLTFQEYMSAIAIVEGHYKEFREEDTTVTPFSDEILNDEWKEVVPMAAVLAKKRAAPLIGALLAKAEHEKELALGGGFETDDYRWNSGYRLPAAVSRLIQCVIEEAEFSQDHLDRTLEVIAIFAHGCQPQENWGALLGGPFGQDQFEKAWMLFMSESLPRQSWIRNTIALMASYRRPMSYWQSNEGLAELLADLSAPSPETRSIAAATICGIYWRKQEGAAKELIILKPYIEASIIRDTGIESIFGFWAIALIFSRNKDHDLAIGDISVEAAEAIVNRWFKCIDEVDDDVASFALTTSGLARGSYEPSLDDERVNIIRKVLSKRPRDEILHHSDWEAAALLAYRGRVKVDGPQALKVMEGRYFGYLRGGEAEAILRYLGATEKQIGEIRENGRPVRRRRPARSNTRKAKPAS